MDINCVILAGGKGLRLGHDKILEIVGNRSLLRQVISRINLLCSDIIVVLAEKRNIPGLIGYQKLRIVTDTYPGKGPLGGIYTGLTTSDSFYNLVVASDMPFLNEALLSHMIELSADFDIVVPRVGNLVEPLHAVYSKACSAIIKDMIEQDTLSVHELFRRVRVRYMDAGEIERFDPEHLSFFNINTKEDLKTARELAKRESVR